MILLINIFRNNNMAPGLPAQQHTNRALTDTKVGGKNLDTPSLTAQQKDDRNITLCELVASMGTAMGQCRLGGTARGWRRRRQNRLQSFTTHSKQPRQLHEGIAVTCIHDAMIITAIILLRALCRPYTVVFRVIAIGVLAFKRVFGAWLSPHVSDECCKRGPFHRNTTGAVVYKLFVAGIFTAAFHRAKNRIFWSVRHAMRCIRFSLSFTPQTATTLRLSTPQLACVNRSELPTVTVTDPCRFPFRSLGSPRLHDQSSEPLPGQVQGFFGMPTALTPTTLGISVPQMIGLDQCGLSTVTRTQPTHAPFSRVRCAMEHRQQAIALPSQVWKFAGGICGVLLPELFPTRSLVV